MEALSDRLVTGEIATQGFERHVLVQQQVMCFVDFSHPAPADEPSDAIALRDDVPNDQGIGGNGERAVVWTSNRVSLDDAPFDLGAQLRVIGTLAVQEGLQVLQGQVERGFGPCRETPQPIRVHPILHGAGASQSGTP